MRRHGSESGYTLIGLCHATAAIGVSAAIVALSIPVVQDWRTASACRAEKQRVEVAVSAYRVLTGNAAESIDQLVAEAFLKDAVPTADGYSITVAAGVVTASGACT